MVSKIITFVGESPVSWEEATTNLIKEAQTSLSGITRIRVIEFDVRMENEQVSTFRVKAEVAFKVEVKK
ncbi:MAG: dodecin domain-containing protein [Nitrospirae bacterium]|nr:dodecin domain-containing protein [Nitrospirota bacterium]